MFRSFFIIGLDGIELTAEDKKILSLAKPSGVIIFERNLDDSKNWYKWYRSLVEDICKTLGTNQLLLCIDHEGGRVLRFKTPFTQFPYPWHYKKHSYEVGKQMGRELALAGINLNFAPCVDVLSNQSNTVIGQRAFSSNPVEVKECAKSFVDGLQAQGVYGCFKHYPGHGSTSEDSHFCLPVVKKSLEDLQSCELIPYKRIPEKLQFVMTAHVVFPEVDQMPATLSSKFLNLLRNDLNYSGYVVSDDIEMNALSSYFDDQIGLFEKLKAVNADFVIYSANRKIFHETIVKMMIDKMSDRIASSSLSFLSRLKVSVNDLDYAVFREGEILLRKIENCNG
ncbi:MAG: beta-N-acetylhexosaminidase [Deltaproteobacteria bacterium]|nr:beta-N-acetylhexosaminidase [Deltaproteobacteria bacterium]